MGDRQRVMGAKANSEISTGRLCGGTFKTIMFRPSGGCVVRVALIPWLAPWATDLSSLRGFFPDATPMGLPPSPFPPLLFLCFLPKLFHLLETRVFKLAVCGAQSIFEKAETFTKLAVA